MNRTASICAMAMSSVLLAACGSSGGSANTSTSGAKTTTTQSTARSGQGSTTTGTTPTSPTSTSPTSSAPQGASNSTEPSPRVVRASSGDVTATMHATTHHPHVNAHWPISFLVTRSSKPVKAEVRYEYLFAGQVVAHRSHYRFTGSFHDIFMWPSSAVGYPLTFRAMITAGGATLNLDYPVQVVG
jgi:hypothetical protein